MIEFHQGNKVLYRSGKGWEKGTVMDRLLNSKGEVSRYVILTHNLVRVRRTPQQVKPIG